MFLRYLWLESSEKAELFEQVYGGGSDSESDSEGDTSSDSDSQDEEDDGDDDTDDIWNRADSHEPTEPQEIKRWDTALACLALSVKVRLSTLLGLIIRVMTAPIHSPVPS